MTGIGSAGDRSILRALAGLGLTVLLATDVAAGTDAAREAAVEAARAGDGAAAIVELERLHRSAPTDPAVLADLVVVLRNEGENERIVEWMEGRAPASLPDYAHMSWAGALRDQGRFADAADVLADSRHAIGPRAHLLYAAALAESGFPDQALEALPAPGTPGLDADEHTLMAYVLRIAGEPRAALRAARHALDAEPGLEDALRQRILALSGVGAAGSARRLADANPGLMSAELHATLVNDHLAAQLREALRERLRRERAGQMARRDEPVEEVLESLQVARLGMDPGGTAFRRNTHDQIFVLRELGRHAEAVALWEGLEDRDAAPPYVRRAVADGYLATREPERAGEMYAALIGESDSPDASLLTSRYFSLIEAEDYAAAAEVLERLVDETPIWLRVPEERPADTPNWERVGVEQLQAMDRAYRNRADQADAMLAERIRRAPANADLRNAHARVLRWRGWPQASVEATQLAELEAPEAADTRLNHAANARDLGDFARWEQELETLERDFPRNSRVRTLARQWEDRGRPAIRGEVEYGRTSGPDDQTGLTGDRDLRTELRLDSPWSRRNHLRAFALHRTEQGEYDDRWLRQDRVGVGLEWEALRRNAWVRLDADRQDSSQLGLAMGWSHWLNDHWNYSLEVDSRSLHTPLRASDAGLDGERLNGSVFWRASERLSAYGGLSLLRIDDGNRRVSATAGATRRLHASAHHVTEGGVDLFAERNSQPGGPYFNPRHSASGSLRLEHDWLTWRDYDRSLTQEFRVSAGMGYQADFGSAAIGDAGYHHRWQLGPRWSLHYGVGASTRVYDGDREQRYYLQAGFEGRF
ncbi:poly-beta-1,6 N-acetyl-D-glucosamine export porin PgaA [Thioalkalivibrio sp. ALE21]|uniref:poly-beta-1,6 N-acetyl-D-glucosamine export porin PgaA n=1 Tax=Thioalkalivibrio sp. ALE21 TaxID=1158175 RepID=UPI000D99879D|nr:poly-beta-1,6 N-acetyl-D-glucosamine export porin PgaA [Thioalkalivibrio sp. ALE21]PYG01533.1 poly-beta-1,6 N-acetyl-D-glucosamine export porin PgaA [Thioalkalivibrio sp. ALE21]